MSRLGKLPIELPAGTQAKIEKDFIIVKGPKGELKTKTHEIVKIEISEKEIKLSIDDQTIGKNKALWGLYRSLIKNMVVGVNEGYTKKLILEGVGFKSEVAGNVLKLALGFSHPVNITIPEGLTVTADKNNITVFGIDKELVGYFTASVRANKKPEPYKGKGFRYSDEVIRRKQGKKAS